ncbi:MAG TPA: hypothetical protein VKC60_17215 [Opitutaceae bacterium]|nr:hypothetical protein [Opitutaceae bacterium]
MKNFTIPVIIVLCFGMIFGFVAMASFSFARLAATRTSAAEEQMAAQKRQRDRVQQGIAAMVATNDTVTRFLAEWRDDLDFGEDMVPIFNELNTIATGHQVSQGPRNQDSAATYTFKGKSFKVKRYIYSVSGDFPLLFHWLHDAEFRFPLARFESVAINNTGQSLEMQTAVVFPREFKIP